MTDLSAGAAPKVVLEHVSQYYGPLEVLKDISLTIDNGSFVSIVGPSGCGKSTLLKLI